MNLYYVGGLFVGSVVGTVFVGGLAGWAVRKLFKLDWPRADALGIIIVAALAAWLNGQEMGLAYGQAALIYGGAGLIAWAVLQRIRPKENLLDYVEPVAYPADYPTDTGVVGQFAAPQQSQAVARASPRRFPWKRTTGVILTVVLGTIGSTFIFSAFRQVASPTMFGGSPEFAFFAGALFTIPCVFIYIYMIR